MVNRLFIPPANRAFSDIGTPEAAARLYVYQTGTSTQVQLYADSDLAVVLSQPLEADSDGVFQPAYVDEPGLFRILITDADDVPLSGYPMDDVVLWPGAATDASSIAFSPTDAIPETNVQAAIETAAAANTGQALVIARDNTVWPTSGTGNAYTITPTPAITSYGAGQAFWIRPDRTSSGPATLNVNGLGARDIQKMSSAGTPAPLISGDLGAYREILVADDGARFLILSRRDVASFGSDANGLWDKFSGGLMLVTGTATLVFNSASTLTATVTFPGGGFAITARHVDPVFVSLSASAVTVDEIGQIRNSAKNTTTATFVAYRVGAHNFITGDTMSITYSAIGRY